GVVEAFWTTIYILACTVVHCPEARSQSPAAPASDHAVGGPPRGDTPAGPSVRELSRLERLQSSLRALRTNRRSTESVHQAGPEPAQRQTGASPEQRGSPRSATAISDSGSRPAAAVTRARWLVGREIRYAPGESEGASSTGMTDNRSQAIQSRDPPAASPG